MKHSLAIKAENISKQYRLGEVGTGTITHDLNRFWAKLRGKEDPYLKIGEANDRSRKGDSEYVWSLRDINFEIEQGDAVGIIGRNGAGKSTLLKLLSKVTQPTTGSFKVNGRIASLLEVGTGFNPEMTGRENIYLNGAILGMRKHEIDRKFDEIVDFSGVERYIDTPVKRYSSGMYVRLAFAVAAHLESEILIVDEVLAVGDAEFQKKCLGKMGDVSKGEGRTVLFVSHNMAAVQNLCNKGILLDKGKVISQGDVHKVLGDYLNTNQYEIFPNFNKDIFLSNFNSYTIGDKAKPVVAGLNAIFEFEITSKIEKYDILIGLGINDLYGNRLITPFSKHTNNSFHIKKGLNRIVCEIEKFPLKPSTYNLEVYVGTENEVYDYYDKGLSMDVEIIGNNNLLNIPDNTQGSFIINQKWV
ncbi:ABC transporter ATP-binding protein [Cloacibacterium normanense]|uniref:ABC transporter family protein n=1 Tax=Cloacibacterium normanense TaxID=237258 RepID=A0A1E5UFS3_9FLAO|nr:ABC transporter ATP-binding protein [Cloacibacterium normanense]AZI69926.1 ATP-binding cassette domain-containing protein [Cloacibacterium normanense]OEL11744.1 ABC transporter family protein [Cloacibacterium normanense]SDO57332.1 lipopolysaccharide transport system ATP-binding protein [Cloacibacterium normanense]